MAGSSLDVFIEESTETISQIVDRDLAAGLDPRVDRIAVINQNLGNLHVEVSRKDRPVGKPTFRLFGKPIDENHRRMTLVAVMEVREVEPVSARL